jgi:hypothetical protein
VLQAAVLKLLLAIHAVQVHRAVPKWLLLAVQAGADLAAVVVLEADVVQLLAVALKSLPAIHAVQLLAAIAVADLEKAAD